MPVDSFQPKACDDLLDLFAGGSTPEKIVSFKPSKESQQRVSELLQKNKILALTPEEEVELDDYEQLEHLMRLMKARALKYCNRSRGVK